METWEWRGGGGFAGEVVVTAESTGIEVVILFARVACVSSESGFCV